MIEQNYLLQTTNYLVYFVAKTVSANIIINR